MPLTSWSNVPPAAAFAALFVMATLLAWLPGFIARRNGHPLAGWVNVTGAAWLLVCVPLMWFRPDLSMVGAIAWVLVAGAAFIRGTDTRRSTLPADLDSRTTRP